MVIAPNASAVTLFFRKMASSSSSPENTIGKALHQVLERIAIASCSRKSPQPQIKPRLVAVSKTKPISFIQEAYRCGQRHFGENYVQELEDKGRNLEIIETCPEIRWHYIGHLQKNKVNKVLGVPNLYMIETIDSPKLATAVNNSWNRLGHSEKLHTMVQVNTSGEENKHGCKPAEVSSLVQHIRESCPLLHFQGLMTIGVFDHDLREGPNPDFQCLVRCKEEMCVSLGLDPETIELSMGMSHDFEHAIEIGSTNVRVGSTIFGAREQKQSTSKEPISQNSVS